LTAVARTVVRRKLELDTPGKDGKTLRERYKQRGLQYDQGPHCPAAAEEVVALFWWIHRQRGDGHSAPPPLSIESVYFAQSLRRYWLSPWEVDTLFELDAEYRAFTAERLSPNYQDTPALIPATAANIMAVFRSLMGKPGGKK